MFSKELEEVIEAALADGVLTDKERAVLHKRAQAEGVDPDELDVVIDGRLAKMKRQEDWLRPAPPKEATNQKYGNVLKCPSCGAQVVGGSALCTECGYAFSNVGANSSYEKLSAKLEAIEVAYRDKVSSSIPIYGVSNKVKEKANVIRMFPVPNTRADLLEFLASMSAQISSMKQNQSMQVFEEQTMRKAYEAKYEECVNKARISFANDPDFAPYLQKKSGFFSKLFGK